MGRGEMPGSRLGQGWHSASDHCPETDQSSYERHELPGTGMKGNGIDALSRFGLGVGDNFVSDLVEVVKLFSRLVQELSPFVWVVLFGCSFRSALCDSAESVKAAKGGR